MKKSKGTIKIFYQERNFGFIHSSEYKQDIFFHLNNLNSQSRNKRYALLKPGQTVECEVVENNYGLLANNVNFINKNTAVKHDTEDKLYWCKSGENLEEAFVKKITPLLNKNLIVHPEKYRNPKFIDLLDLQDGSVADLKAVRTPFFTSTRYKMDPQYTVTFNHKDYLYYNKVYPECVIYWWVNWEQLSWKTYSVNPMHGVWSVPFRYMKQSIENKQVHLHEYLHRVNDEINATSSYLFDLRNFKNLLLN